MKLYQIELTSAQIAALFEMCEYCSSVIHAKTEDKEQVPPSFGLVMSIQDKLDGCDGKVLPSLIEQAGEELGTTDMWAALPELGEPKT